MGLFNFLSKEDINDGVLRCRNTEGAVLIDVRSVQEYREGHIEGSINLPLHLIEDVEEEVPLRQTPIFVYCHSGVRSEQAADVLRAMGYLKAENIGGIMDYKGEIIFNE